MRALTVRERPDLLDPAWQATQDVIPEYNRHGAVLGRYMPRLSEERADFQFHLVGDGDEILARARAIPIRWDGSLVDLPAGIDAAITRGFEEGDANVLCALLIAVPRRLQGQGLSSAALTALRALADKHGLSQLIAPVRPSWKERYPLTPIGSYAIWRRPDGLLFDPWMRVHERLGGTVLRAEPQSLRISGSVADWERWTKLTFPASGEYWFPQGLATLEISRERDAGTYYEPNVWMHHRL
ncbi:MAG: GNAT family N-acetyltransferase [Candidatus Dormibacteria bacterium]